MAECRALHWVLKIGNLKKSMYFFEKVLNLKVLRHEEFLTGCEATCNGPYAGAWSKTMIGKGPEQEHFALELTYNYGIDSYEFGNDLQYIAMAGDVDVIKTQAELAGFSVREDGSALMIPGPDNYKYRIIPSVPGRTEDFAVVGIRVSDLAKAEDYWVNLLGLQKLDTFPGLETSCPSSVVGFATEQTRLQLIQVDDGAAVNHGLSSGRIAFACKSVPPIHQRVQEANETVLTPPLTLPTPGKADVVVTILADRDGYEICFVEDVAFYQLAEPKYDVINFIERATRGGDGAPPPKAEKLEQHLPEVTDVDQLQEVFTQAGDKVVVVDFGAGWCKNCKKIAPSLEKMAVAFAEVATFVAVDISDSEDLAMEYNVSSVPRLLYFKNGEKVDDYLGSTVGDIRSKLEALVPNFKEEDARRSCHWVLKIGNLKNSMHFYENVLGLKVLRHEEFLSGCEATCNGPYAGAWSKTMIGYGPEKEHFALELTYNFGIDGYAFGNDLQYLALAGDKAAYAAKAAEFGYACEYVEKGEALMIQGPDNYKYRIISPIEGRGESWAAVGLRVNDLAQSLAYWVDLLGLTSFDPYPGLEVSYPSKMVAFKDSQVMLHLIQVGDGASVDHALSSGRIAFACKAVPPIYEKVKSAGHTIMTPPLTLPTPGKADVVVTILADPNGYEICFVEDEAFYDLATPKYDVIDFVERASRGGDGAPPPKVALEHGATLKAVTQPEEVQESVASAGDKLVVLDFGAGWCKNCKKLAPSVEAMAQQLAKYVVFLSVDLDEAEELAMEYEVKSVPAFRFLKEGKVAGEYLGNNASDLRAQIEALLPGERESVKRSLHWVFKIGNLKKSMEFYEDILGLRVLRHEEFESGCEATCNGPYAGQWSKTMIGYGPEKENFALELTYNYGIDSYEFGNDFQYIAVSQPSALKRAKLLGHPIGEKDGSQYIVGPDGYCFKALEHVPQAERFMVVALRVSNLARSEAYWVDLLGLTKFEVPSFLQTKDPSILVGFSDDQVKLQLIAVADGQEVNHAKSSGRIAFACPTVPPIFEKVSAAGHTVLTPPLTLPTPGKADVVVTILADPDGYEICFVEDAAFYDLATPKYDVIDWTDRASRGADGAPPPGKKK